MASNMYAVKCPCCGRSAIIDDYYKTNEQFIYCLRCGYNYAKTIKSYTDQSIEYNEEKYEGNGVFILVKKDGSYENMMLNNVTEKQLEKYKASFIDDNVDLEKSYLVSYKNGVFTILRGNPPENFHLPFEAYRKKVIAKYGNPEFDFMVPIEE